MGSKPLNRKIRLFAAIRKKGREAAAAASTRGSPPFICVTMGDQNLTTDEALYHQLSQSLDSEPMELVASEGVQKEGGGRVNQDFVAVEFQDGVSAVPIRSGVIGFDQVHQAVLARIRRSLHTAAPAARTDAAPVGAARPAASSAAAASAAVASAPRGRFRPRGFLRRVPRRRGCRGRFLRRGPRH